MSNRKWVRIFCRWIFNKGCFLHLLMLLLIAAINDDYAYWSCESLSRRQACSCFQMREGVCALEVFGLL
jgi:hypothetical protein